MVRAKQREMFCIAAMIVDNSKAEKLMNCV